jgi:hypothetical protein
MLTVKWYETPLASVQVLIQAKRVRTEQPADPEKGTHNVVGLVYVERDDGQTEILSTGTVYVMNDAGKTVANYHLAAPAPTEAKAA